MLNIPIVIAAYNRPHTLARLLKSLAQAEYSQQVKLIISIDGGENREVTEFADNFQWEWGEKEIIQHNRNLGLRKHILTCGDLSQYYDGIILLEDDLYVSPFFYEYTLEALKYYTDDHKIAGISLYSHNFNETALVPFRPLLDGSDVFFLQIASSWGQCWTKKQWQGFKGWYEKADSKNISTKYAVPQDVAGWPESSWKKYFIKYLIEKDLFFVYPRVSLTTNFGDKGEHHTGNQWFQVPFLQSRRKFTFQNIANSIAIYDAFCEIIPDCLCKLQPGLNTFDFSVDLHGLKSLSQCNSKYILTSKVCENPKMQWGRELLPSESNIIEDVSGKTFSLSKKEHCADITDYKGTLSQKSSSEEEVFFHFRAREFHFYKKIQQIKKRDQLINNKDQLILTIKKQIQKQINEIQLQQSHLNQQKEVIAAVKGKNIELMGLNKWREKVIKELRTEVNRLKSTLSWKLTKPLRAIGRILKTVQDKNRNV